MKRIISGKTYNTDTATEIGQARWPSPGNTDHTGEVDHPVLGRMLEMQGDWTEANMYVTRGGDLFIVQRLITLPGGVERLDRHAGELIPMSPKEFANWLKERMDADPVETRYWGGRDPMAFAAKLEKAMAEHTLYVRVPTDLKDRAEARAKTVGLSLNAWVMRCVERCLGNHPV